MPINVALVGFGMASQVFHAPLIMAEPRLNLHTVVQRQSQTARERYPTVQVVADLGEALANPALELVVIATPNQTHADLAAQALSAGKHVVVDKPFTLNSGQADLLIALAEQQQRVLSVFHNRRWDGDFLTTKAVIDAGWLGRLASYECHYDRYRPQLKQGAWREQASAGSGILYDLGSHLIDQAVVLFGLPQTIMAQLAKQRDGAQTVDYFDLRLGYSELQVTLKAGMLVRETGPRFSLHGTHGSWLKAGTDSQEAALKAGQTPNSPNWGHEPAADWGMLNTEANGLALRGTIETLAGNYPAYYRNLAQTISGEADLAVTAKQAREVIRLIELAEQSAAEQRTIAV
ncbi:oxidoreductase [Herpetosiphon giganteus]|uniref:oxidoreductase n=1 Tax=Herpetosiphon giganteus TaxID=2029754 RepID=UPI00195C50CA|nr:oxidoreductase [Herpetosiphon giganteus]MBM7843942.1 putative dehydrogenase [Herpetosiphon giganteus]